MKDSGALPVVEIPQRVEGIHRADRVVDQQRVVVPTQMKRVHPLLQEPRLSRCRRVGFVGSEWPRPSRVNVHLGSAPERLRPGWPHPGSPHLPALP